MRARGHAVRAQVPDADPQELLLLDELLGIADPGCGAAEDRPGRAAATADRADQRGPAGSHATGGLCGRGRALDRRGQRIHARGPCRGDPADSLDGADHLPPGIPAGCCRQGAGAQTIALAPLSDAETSSLVAELLGSDPSVGQIGEIIAGRAAGNPFFAEEITRELAERGVLVGERGGYTCRTDVADIGVPPTLQATIAARIDRLSPAAKQTLAAAAVIGFRFEHRSAGQPGNRADASRS